MAAAGRPPRGAARARVALALLLAPAVLVAAAALAAAGRGRCVGDDADDDDGTTCHSAASADEEDGAAPARAASSSSAASSSVDASSPRGRAVPPPPPCEDRHPLCDRVARAGECRRFPGWMIVNCCKSCDDAEGYGPLVDDRVRCDPNRLNSTIPAWTPGDLDALFSSWATGDALVRRHAPRAASSPGGVHGAAINGPWIVTFDDFLSDGEVDALLRGATLGGGGGFRRSANGAPAGEAGEGNDAGGGTAHREVVSETRTSASAWCEGPCEELPGVRGVAERIEEITGIPANHYEPFQILQYQEGQFYRRHHDSPDANGENPAGHRILTFFFYLNDVEEGGETMFTDLNVSISPKKGRALIWPSVLNEDPNSWDTTMYHEAKDVIKGTKYAANLWIHQYDYRNANLWGCAGSFA